MTSSCAEYRRVQPLLGTFVEVVLCGGPRAELEKAATRAFAVIARVQRLMSYFDPASNVSRLNAAPAGEAVAVDRWTWSVIRDAQRLAHESDGTFDITIAPELVRLGYLPCETPRIARASRATFRDLEVLPMRQLRAQRPLRIDLGGIAKGFAVDRAIDTLQRAGIPRALVNAGGDVRGYGSPAWPIHIRHPQTPGNIAAVIALQDAALATSATYFSRRRKRGREIHPILDGAKRQPVSTAASVSVQAPRCMLADALTKIVAAHPKGAIHLLQRYRASALILSTAGKLTVLESADAP